MIATLMWACETPEQPTPEEPDKPNNEEPKPEEPKDDPVAEFPVVVENYMQFGAVRRTMQSGYYTTNDMGENKQYIFVMSPTAGLDTYEAIVESGQYIFVSIDEATLFEAIGNNSGKVNVWKIEEDNEIYMFILKIAKSALEDYAYDHSEIIMGELTFYIDFTTNDIVLQADYTTARNEALKVEALLHYVAPEVPQMAGYLRYEWDGKGYNYPLATAYAYTKHNATTYTLCRDNVKTFVSTEDTITLSLTIEGVAIGEDFVIDLATTTEEYQLTLYDPINGLPTKSITTANREGIAGRFAVNGGAVSCELEATTGELQSLEAHLDVNEFRALNECTKVVYDEYMPLFTPTAVSVVNSGENYRIETVGEGHTFTVEYPAEGWEKWLLKGNFISGSNYPTMTITLDGVSYTKGVGDCYGMNAQFKRIDLDKRTITLNANLYTEEGGVALYYDGEFELIEQ